MGNLIYPVLMSPLRMFILVKKYNLLNPLYILADSSTVGWLVGWFWFNGPLRQYFSLYQAISQGKGEREENDREE